MRFNRLHLLACGPFTNATIDLSGGHSGLHMVYGPNEAGKTSSLRAITNLLFGFEARSPDRFIHDYSKLRVGAQLQDGDGSRLDVVRRKAKQKTLRGLDDSTPIEDAALDRMLGGIDRDLFGLMFGIDHERLRKGGEEVVHGGGRIGELLFAAGAGLSGLRKVQSDLQAEIDSLLKPSGRSGLVHEGINEYQKKQREMVDAQVTAETWKTHDKALRRAQYQQAELDKAIQEKRTDVSRLTRIHNAIAVISQRKRAISELADVAAVPLLPEGFAETSSDTLIDFRNAQQQVDNCTSELAGISKQLEQLDVPLDLLAEADAIESLKERLGSYRKSLTKFPELQTACSLATAEVKEILRRLGRDADLENIEDLRLPADQIIRIQELGNRREGLLERVQSATKDRSRISRSIAKDEKTLSETRVPAGGAELNAKVIEIQQQGDLEASLEKQTQELQALEANARVLLNRLPLWSGTLQEVENLAVPADESVDRFEREFGEAEHQVQTLRNRIQEFADRIEQVQVELQELELVEEVPSIELLTLSRQLREQGWQLIQRVWRDQEEDTESVAEFVERFAQQANLGDAYRQSVGDADQLADLLRTDAERVATKAKLESELRRLAKKHKETDRELQVAETERSARADRWVELWQPADVQPRSPREMRSWLAQHRELQQITGAVRSTQLQLGQTQETIDQYRKTLVAALKRVNANFEDDVSSLQSLLKLAAKSYQDVCRQEGLVERASNSLRDAHVQLADAESRLADAESEMNQWQTDWSSAMKQLGLDDDATPSQAGSVLRDLETLFQKQQEAQQSETEMEVLRGEAEDFDADVAEMVCQVTPEWSKLPTEQAMSKLATDLRTARSKDEEKVSLEKRRDNEQKKLKQAQERVAQKSSSLDEMCRLAECESPQELSSRAGQSSKRRILEQSVETFEEQILNLSGGASLDDFVDQVEDESFDVDSLRPRIDQLESEITELRKQRDECLAEIQRVRTELAKFGGGSVAADLDADCQGIAARLDDQVQRLASLRLSAAVLKAGIERYREHNQDPVITRASEIFSHITLGAFSGLQADFGDQNERIIVGLRNGTNAQMRVSEMSDGTCDQVYLALRLAILEGWLDRHDPIPLVVDDVLLNFDDQRAAATLQVLANLSHRTQVIFFTHHSHLVDIAKQSVESSDLFMTHLPGYPAESEQDLPNASSHAGTEANSIR